MNLLSILVPLCALVVLNLPFRQLRRFATALALLLAGCQVLAAAACLIGALGAFEVPFFCMQAGQPDKAACVVLLAAGLVAAASLLSARALIADGDRRFDFVNLLLVALAGLNGVATVRDIFTLYVFIEVAAVASFILISFTRERAALQAAFKYLILSAFASVLMLSSVALLLVVSGETGFAGIRQAIAVSPHNALVMLALAVFVCGTFVKGGLVPFHGWLPDVYSSAAAPVSVLLAGSVTKTLGSFVLIRLAVSVAGFSGPLGQVVLFVGALSIVAGALAALVQSDLKRLLAFSSISQMGYIVLGAGAGSPLGIAGALLHLFNHSVFKSTLFINAAAVEDGTATRDMAKLGGMSSRMPVTSVTSVVSWLSASGIPPFAGFWSKLLIVVALWATGHYAYAAIAVVASVLTLAYFLFMQRKVFQGELKVEFEKVSEAKGLLVPACLLAAITVGLGLAFPFCLKLLKF